MKQDLFKLLVLGLPLIPVFAVYHLYAKHKKRNWIEALGLSLIINGFFWAPITFLALIGLGLSGKMKFHDWAGLGYMVLLFIGPLMVLAFFAVPGAILNLIGNMFGASAGQKSLALSPEALAILHGLNAPAPRPPLPTQATWRDYAKNAQA